MSPADGIAPSDSDTEIALRISAQRFNRGGQLGTSSTVGPRNRTAGSDSKPSRAASVKSRGGERLRKSRSMLRQVRSSSETGMDQHAAQRMPADWLGGARHKSDVKLRGNRRDVSTFDFLGFTFGRGHRSGSSLPFTRAIRADTRRCCSIGCRSRKWMRTLYRFRRPSRVRSIYPASSKSATIRWTARSVMPTRLATSLIRASGSRAMQRRTWAWLVRNVQAGAGFRAAWATFRPCSSVAFFRFRPTRDAANGLPPAWIASWRLGRVCGAHIKCGSSPTVGRSRRHSSRSKRPVHRGP